MRTGTALFPECLTICLELGLFLNSPAITDHHATTSTRWTILHFSIFSCFADSFGLKTSHWDSRTTLFQTQCQIFLSLETKWPAQNQKIILPLNMSIDLFPVSCFIALLSYCVVIERCIWDNICWYSWITTGRRRQLCFYLQILLAIENLCSDFAVAYLL
jgi:hypothetical protein